MKATIVHASDGVIQDLGNMKLKKMLDEPSLPFSINWIKRTSNETREGYETDQEVAFYVLEGSSEVIVDGQSASISQGDVIFFPKGVRWKFLEGVCI